MAQRVAIGRIIGTLIAIAGLVIAALWGDAAVRMKRELEQAQVARPLEASVDLSRTGALIVPLRQTYVYSHGEALCLQCDLGPATDRPPTELLTDLAGAVTIADSQGVEVRTIPFNTSRIRPGDKDLTVGGTAPFEQGEYRATIRVTSGAAALAGKPQVLYMKYEFCGLEAQIVLYIALFAAGAGLVGLIAAACVLPGWLRYGLRRAPAAESTTRVTP